MVGRQRADQFVGTSPIARPCSSRRLHAGRPYSSDMHVIIVGAGPAGAALSLLLARNGCRVTLIERETKFERVFRGEGLMPLGLEVLHQMGLREQMRAVPGAPFECWQIYLDRQLTMRIDEPMTELGDLAFRVASPSALIALLIEEASVHGGFSFRPGTSVRGLLHEGERVTGVRASTPTGEEGVAGDLVIGADGRSSVVRQRSGLELTRLPEEYDLLWFKAEVPSWMRGTNPMQIYASGPAVALSYVSWDGRWQVAWLLEKGTWRELKDRDWLADCASLMPTDLATHLLAERDALDGPNLLDIIVGRCPRWHRPGVLLLGDAVHPMSPVRAQGINMALRDAVVAANHLVPALGDGGSVDAALAAIQAEREPEVVNAQTLQFRELRGQRWARKRPWLMAPLLKLAPLMAKASWFGPMWLRQQHPLRFGSTEVRLRV